VSVRILVTNDDGIGAPGIAALAHSAHDSGHDVVVVAPLVDYSGAGAAVGPVHSRDGIDYESRPIDGLEHVPAFGIDGPPALAVILAAVGGFGARPDLVLSGINHGANVGRSALHSGTVGAALTAAHFGMRALAVSIRWGEDPVPWETPARLAGALVPLLGEADDGSVLNLNVPDLAPDLLRGVRHGRLGRSGAIRSAVHEAVLLDTGPAGTAGNPDHHHLSVPPFPSGTLRLDLTPPGSDADPGLDTDAGLLANGYACLTPLVGVREALDSDSVATLNLALDLLAVPGSPAAAGG
jgi:5'/3'-nucleotidase